MTTNVNEWINQLELLSKIAAIEPQSAYCRFQAQSNLYHEDDSRYLPIFTEA